MQTNCAWCSWKSWKTNRSDPDSQLFHFDTFPCLNHLWFWGSEQTMSQMKMFPPVKEAGAQRSQCTVHTKYSILHFLITQWVMPTFTSVQPESLFSLKHLWVPREVKVCVAALCCLKKKISTLCITGATLQPAWLRLMWNVRSLNPSWASHPAKHLWRWLSFSLFNVAMPPHSCCQFEGDYRRWFYLGMSVLAGLGSGHLHNFAGTSLQHHIAVFAQSRALHRVGGGGARLATREIKIGICHGAMGQGRWKKIFTHQSIWLSTD